MTFTSCRLLFLDGLGEKLTHKCCYFIRDSKKPVRTNIPQDNSVIVGEITADILDTFESTLSKVYTPILSNQEEWGHIKRHEEKQAFLSNLSRFQTDLQKKLSNLCGDIQLKTPVAPYDNIEPKPASYAEAVRDPQLLFHFCGIVDS